MNSRAFYQNPRTRGKSHYHHRHHHHIQDPDPPTGTDFDVTIGQCVVSDLNLTCAVLIKHTLSDGEVNSVCSCSSCMFHLTVVGHCLVVHRGLCHKV